MKLAELLIERAELQRTIAEYAERLRKFALVKREVLKSRRGIFHSLQSACELADSRYSRKEIKFVTAFDLSKTIDITDQLSKELRILDARIQALNWEVEVTVEE